MTRIKRERRRAATGTGRRMRERLRLGALFAVAVGLLAIGIGEHAVAQTVPGAEQSCEAAATLAETQYDLPPGLLRAIGREESGRREPGSGRVVAWPWTINAEGRGRWFDSAETAQAAVRDLQASGVSSIDVGCFQINLMYHPAAFAALDQGFDAARNADYAARFLLALKARTGTWDDAVAAYHSAIPERGTPYRERVMAGWARDGGRPAMGPEPRPGTEPRSPALPTGPVVMRMETWVQPPQAFGGMRIWTPSAAGRGASVITISAPASRTKP